MAGGVLPGALLQAEGGEREEPLRTLPAIPGLGRPRLRPTIGHWIGCHVSRRFLLAPLAPPLFAPPTPSAQMSARPQHTPRVAEAPGGHNPQQATVPQPGHWAP